MESLHLSPGAHELAEGRYRLYVEDDDSTYLVEIASTLEPGTRRCDLRWLDTNLPATLVELGGE